MTAKQLLKVTAIVVCFTLAGALAPSVMAQPKEPDGSDASTVLAQFSQSWPADRKPYRHEEDTTSWMTYALSMKRLVALGDEAVPGLIKACDDRNFQVRALSARVLGYLGAKSAVPKLIELLDDEQAPVALLAADALGQIQDPAGLEALKAARGWLNNGDVLLHVAKSLERGVPLESDVRQQILRIDGESINSAKIGQPAPDFTLKDAAGKVWSLADFRDRKTIVLTFIYGDG